MKYNEHMGKIYDVIYYGVIYFNKQSVVKKFEERGHEIEGAFTYFDEVKNNCQPLPDCLLPFFYYDAITPCFLSEYFITSLNFRKHKFGDFVNISQNTLKQNLFDYLFVNLPEDVRRLTVNKKDSEAVGRAFNNEAWSAEMIKQAMFLLYNFDYVSDMLIKTLIDIYKHIEMLHNKYKDKIIQRINETRSKENLILFEKIYMINMKAMQKNSFSICFMNQYTMFNKPDNNDEFAFIFGYRYKETLDAHINKKSISLEKALSVLGDPIRFRMIVCIDKYGFLTMSDLCRLIDISKSTAFRGINVLYEEKVILESHRDGIKIYYKLNNEYLRSANTLFNKFVNELK